MLVSILIILAMVVIAIWLIDLVGFPNPINWLVKGIVVLVAVWQLLLLVGISIPI